MTTKQRNFWLAALALAAIIYFGPRFLASRRVAPAPEPETRRPKVEAPAPTPPPPAPGVEAFNGLLGIWTGTAPLPAGMCGLKFELRKKADDPNRFSGFPVLVCTPVMATLPGQMGPTAQQGLLARLSPLSATLTGSVVNGSLHFSVDRVIGKTVDGCAISAFTVTPFGEDQLVAEWQEGSCPEQPNGQILLRRTAK
jgi:hypothetical protein